MTSCAYCGGPSRYCVSWRCNDVSGHENCPSLTHQSLHAAMHAIQWATGGGSTACHGDAMASVVMKTQWAMHYKLHAAMLFIELQAGTRTTSTCCTAVGTLGRGGSSMNSFPGCSDTGASSRGTSSKYWSAAEGPRPSSPARSWLLPHRSEKGCGQALRRPHQAEGKTICDAVSLLRTHLCYTTDNYGRQDRLENEMIGG